MIDEDAVQRLISQCQVICHGLMREADVHRRFTEPGSQERAIYCDGKTSAFRFIIGRLNELLAANLPSSALTPEEVAITYRAVFGLPEPPQ